ncbi:MAG: hypothetical protein M9918_20255 [Anaerolineae bacterium]|nr:hypothetical protein [Anaerolineae bacterium]MCO5190511.1 hypothetical protein [Anaerolineae bacterium]
MSTQPHSQEGWHIVAETAGIMNAEIIAGRLQAEGIQAQAIWREGAGGEGFGITVGNMGAAYVIVPQALATDAEAILAIEYDDDDEFDDEDYDDDEFDDDDA